MALGAMDSGAPAECSKLVFIMKETLIKMWWLLLFVFFGQTNAYTSQQHMKQSFIQSTSMYLQALNTTSYCKRFTIWGNKGRWRDGGTHKGRWRDGGSHPCTPSRIQLWAFQILHFRSYKNALILYKSSHFNSTMSFNLAYVTKMTLLYTWEIPKTNKF